MGARGQGPHFVFTSPVHLEFYEQGCWTVVLTRSAFVNACEQLMVQLFRSRNMERRRTSRFNHMRFLVDMLGDKRHNITALQEFRAIHA